MNILASILKPLIKQVAVGDMVNFDTGKGVLMSSDPSVNILSFNVLLRDANAARFTVATQQLLAVTSRLTGEVNISYNGKTLVFRSGKGKFELNTASGMPYEYKPKQLDKIEVPLRAFSELIAVPASIAETKQLYNFSGSVQVRQQPTGVVQASATDGRQLLFSSAVIAPDFFKQDMLIPVRAAKAIQELRGDSVRISQDDSAIYFETGTLDTGVILIAKKLAKDFPEFDKLIPKTSKLTHRLRSIEMREVLMRVSPMLKAEDDIQRVQLTFAPDKLHVAVVGNGSAEDELPTEQLSPDPMFSEETFTVNLNHKFLMNFFRMVDGDVTFNATEKTAPVIFSTDKHTFLLATVKA